MLIKVDYKDITLSRLCYIYIYIYIYIYMNKYLLLGVIIYYLIDYIYIYIYNKLAKLVSNSRYLSFKIVSLKDTNVKLASLNTKHQRTTLSNVINLSSRNITIAEETLLNRGLSFCPTSKLDEVKLCQSTEIFCRKVRLAEHFDNSNSDNIQSNHTEHKSTLWTPPAGRNLCIDTFVNLVRGHLNTFIKSKKNLNFHNLPTEEKKSLSNLMTDKRFSSGKPIKAEPSPF